MTQKFRPYFTSAEMLEIISALKESPSPNRLKIIQYLESFNLKITRGLIEPAHTKKPTLDELLGFSTPTTPVIKPSVRRENAYNKWLVNPTQCTVLELKDVNDYRYENGLFTPEEQVAYEKSLGLVP